MPNSIKPEIPRELKYQNPNSDCALTDRVPTYLKDAVNVCGHLPAKYEFEGSKYCVLHFPNRYKSAEFEIELDKMIADGQHFFNGIYFPDNSSFQGKEFKKEVRFSWATFAGVMDFSGTIFEDDVRFTYALFEETAELTFYLTRFDADLWFKGSRIKGHLNFEGGQFYDGRAGGEERVIGLFEKEFSSIDFRMVKIENPGWISFHIVRLQPSWFVGANCKDFVFHDCYWEQWNGEPLDIDEELYVMTRDMYYQIPDTSVLLTSVCRQLAANFEENSRFALASQFRMMANETEWLASKDYRDSWWSKLSRLFKDEVLCRRIFSEFKTQSGRIIDHLRDYEVNLLSRLYRFSSRFGESYGRAVVVLLVILILSSVLYVSPICKFDKDEKRSLGWVESVSYSVRVMVLQRPEPFPINDSAKVVVAMESIFAPLQLALLALAVRRRFMR